MRKFLLLFFIYFNSLHAFTLTSSVQSISERSSAIYYPQTCQDKRDDIIGTSISSIILFESCTTAGLSVPDGSTITDGCRTVTESVETSCTESVRFYYNNLISYQFQFSCDNPSFIYDSSTNSCYDPAFSDDDSDGIPNKCDPSYEDYSTMDCDGDGLTNSFDSDIDGDGLLNGNDPNPYDDGSSSGTSDTPCPATAYSPTPVKTLSECSMSNSLFFPVPDGELRYVQSVFWDECRQTCMFKPGICPYGQVIKDGVCKSVIPDDGDCLGTSNCYITSFGVDTSKSCFKNCYCSTTLDPNPQTPYFTQEVSCSSLEDDKAILEDLESSVDVNKTLPTDLLKDSNATYDLDVSASMKVALDAYAGAKEATQLNLLSESKIQSLQLVNANTNLKTLNDTLENFSAVSTSNDGAINSTLKDIDSGIDISNELLTDIKDNSEVIKNNLEGKNSDGSDVDTSVLNDGFAGVDNFITDVQNGFSNIGSSFTDLSNNIDQGFNYSISGGSDVSFSFSVGGKTMILDLAQALTALSPVIYYFMYVSLILVSIKIIFLAFMVV